MSGTVGKSEKRVDAFDKVTGRARYTDDLCPKDALVAKVLHSTIANGVVKKIDTSAAEQIEGVVKIVTCFDVPQYKVPTAGHPWSTDPHHQDVADRLLLTSRVRFYGDDVAAVVAENEVAAAANGVNVVKFKKMAFVFSALYAGWAGGLYAHYLRYITPALFNISNSSELIITTVLGGLGSLTGSVLGTIIVQLLPEIFRSLAEYRMLVYGIAVVLVILLRPNGLYGYREFSLRRIVTAVTSRLGKGVKSHE